jgi:hypothetical protein
VRASDERTRDGLVVFDDLEARFVNVQESAGLSVLLHNPNPLSGVAAKR